VDEHIGERWLEYAEGTLPEGEARAVAEHLAGCAECQARFRALEAVHRASSDAAAAAGPAPHVPQAVERRILDAARREARAKRPVRVPLWAGLALSAVAAAAVVAVIPALRGAGGPDRSDLGRALALAEGPAGVRGGGPLESEARAALERWRAGGLKLRSAAVKCPAGEERLEALVDGAGAVVALARVAGGRTDLRIWDAQGGLAGAVRIEGGKQEEVVLAPLDPAGARALLDAPACSGRGAP
jgi:hypothetical protein